MTKQTEGAWSEAITTSLKVCLNRTTVSAPRSVEASPEVHLKSSFMATPFVSTPEQSLQLAERLAAPTINVLSQAVSGLLKTRDFLGLQLDFASGNMGESEFQTLSAQYLCEPRKIEPSELRNIVHVLWQSVDQDVDPETVSVMFGCSIEDAEGAFQDLLAEHANG